MRIGNKKFHFYPAQIIALGFLGVILAGALLLTLPAASETGQPTSFIDALFTAVSAVCVTGLVVHDTAQYWSMYGQLVILLLIQIGGMGVVTVAVSAAMLSGKKIGLMQRDIMKESISAPNMKGIVRLTYFIIRVSIVTELAGAVLMAFVFCRELPFIKGCWYALFHSVSAFCNAGFDLMGIKEGYSSLTLYSGHILINAVVMFLIIWGGIGFITWEDIRQHKWKLKKYRMQSKVILTTTALLILLPTLYFYFAEFGNEVWGGLSQKERVLRSMFQAVTPRTAGFNTADLTKLTGAGKFITIALMLIGGSPGSTAGGMKTTTAAVLLLSALAVFRREGDAHCFGRRISVEAVRYAAAIFLMYMVLFSGGAVFMSMVEGLPVTVCLFETASAIGTVGLTLGITPGLHLPSKIILICLMYMGRIGGLTLVFAATNSHQYQQSRYPQEKITVG